MPSWDRKKWELENNIFTPANTVSRDSIRVFTENQSQFGETLVAGRTPVIELNSSYGTSMLRDLEEVTGSGTITAANGTIQLSTGTTAGSTATLYTAEIGRYVPGYSAQFGIGMRRETAVLGDAEIKWGGIGPSRLNGFYFGRDSTGIYVARLNGGVETRVYQANWNVDTLDGTGKSGFDLDLTIGQIYQVEFAWYGYGQIMFGVIALLPDRPSVQTFLPCHYIKVEGDVSIQSPNLAVFAEVDNGTTETDVSIDVGGRQYSIVGSYVPKYRFTGQPRFQTAVTTTRVPLISFRRKTAFNNRSIKLSGATLAPTTNNVQWEIVLGGTLTNPSWGTPLNHMADETALERDISATAITGGHVIWTDIATAGAGNAAGLSSQSVDLDLPNGTVISLCARSVVGNATVDSAFRVREEW